MESEREDHNDSSCVRTLYEQEFEPRRYHLTYYTQLDREVMFFIDSYHRAFTSDPLLTGGGSGGEKKRKRVVEVGCGPVPVYSATAALYTNDITMADLLPDNRKEIDTWMRGEDSALDWSIFFTYIASLTQTRSGSAVAERLRGAFKRVLPCDLALTNPLHPIQERFDVVMSTLCLEFAATSLPQYLAYLGHLVSLLLPNGVLILAGALGNTTYRLGSQQYPSVSLSEEALHHALTSVGLQVASLSTLARQTSPSDKPADHTGVFFLMASRSGDRELVVSSLSKNPSPFSILFGK